MGQPMSPSTGRTWTGMGQPMPREWCHPDRVQGSHGTLTRRNRCGTSTCQGCQGFQGRKSQKLSERKKRPAPAANINLQDFLLSTLTTLTTLTKIVNTGVFRGFPCQGRKCLPRHPGTTRTDVPFPVAIGGHDRGCVLYAPTTQGRHSPHAKLGVSWHGRTTKACNWQAIQPKLRRFAVAGRRVTTGRTGTACRAARRWDSPCPLRSLRTRYSGQPLRTPTAAGFRRSAVGRSLARQRPCWPIGAQRRRRKTKRKPFQRGRVYRREDALPEAK